MVTATSLQTTYNKFFTEFRNYIWNFSIIESLADLEIEVYQAFPDMESLKSKCKKFKRQISSTEAYKQDDKFKTTFEEFESSVEEVDTLYANIKTFREVVVL